MNIVETIIDRISKLSFLAVAEIVRLQPFKTKHCLLASMLFIVSSSCNKYLEVPSPVTTINEDIVYKNDATAIATLNNIYVALSQSGVTGGITSLSLFQSLAADELSLFSTVTDPEFLAYFKNELKANLYGASDYWRNIYSRQIFLINSAIIGLNGSNSLNPVVKNQLLGEAYFLRGFFYFYLINLYGSVPLVLTNDYRINSHLGKSLIEDVYKQIIVDLNFAKSLLSPYYLDGTLLQQSEERVAPVKAAAGALLSRVYLYNKDWLNAKLEADSVIDNKLLFDTVALVDVFKTNNQEAIWQLQSVSNTVTNTSDAVEFLLAKNNPAFGHVYLRSELVKSFEIGDSRRSTWIDSIEVGGTIFYLPAKYKISELNSATQERTVVLRLAEQYLNRAEAKAHLGDLTGALTDLNVIRQRAALSNVSIETAEAILERVMHERKLEFFTEWGHRWFDLKRTGLSTTVLSAVKGASWQPTDTLLPIPLSEIEQNTGLRGQQNPGY